MIFSTNITFSSFKDKANYAIVKKKLKSILSEKKNEVINSLKIDYKYSYSQKFISKLKNKFFSMRLIGMGGSILGMKAIYSFLNTKIKKEIYFFDNLLPIIKKEKKKVFLNIVISKSGNTLETISNTNNIVQRNQKNIFITEKNDNYLRTLAYKLKAEIVDHNNFIGGRYSVLSEVGMLPASLLGLNCKKFKQFNSLIKKKNFINSLVSNVSSILFFIKKKKNNSIILNYDENSEDLFKWYQQLIGESLGKNHKGIFPFISTMPKDNHSLMQLYLDGPQKNFFTFFGVSEKRSNKILNSLVLDKYKFIKGKKLSEIIDSQRIATQNVFNKKKIPFRTFVIKKRNEETLGELFTFFILETILLGECLKLNPYNQPAVELIKKSTKKTLLNI